MAEVSVIILELLLLFGATEQLFFKDRSDPPAVDL